MATIPSQYGTQIATMRKENPTAFATDEDAYNWGSKNYGWGSGGSGGTGTSSSTAAWGDQSKYADTYAWTPTAAPAYNAPKYASPGVAQPTLGAAPTYAGPANFSYGEFQAPDAQTVQNDPGYQFRLKQGVAARDASAAARGTLRGGNQLAALESYGQGLASDEYGNAFNRAAQTYATNYGVAKDTYGAAKTAADDAYGRGLTERNSQYGAGVDAYGRDAAERQATFSNATTSATAEYAPTLASWQASNLAGQDAAEKNWNRGGEMYQFGKNDAYRWSDLNMSDAYRNRSLNMDDAYRYAALSSEEKRALLNAGNY